MSRGVSRQAGIPPTLCTAKTRAGEPCKNYCSVGRVTCYLHGGAAGQVVRKAEERVTFAQLLQSDPRPVGEVLLDALHNADVAMRDVRARLVEEGQPVTVDQLDRFINLSRLTHHLAKTSIDAGVEVALVSQQRATVQEAGTFVAEILLTVLNALPLHPAWRSYLLDLAHHHLVENARREGTHLFERPDGPPSEPPVPPQAPILLDSQPAIPPPFRS
jgi:hypothetical protein